MICTNINQLYFDWLCVLVQGRKSGQYNKLLKHLHDTEFTYIIPLDGNRFEDGIELRYRFGLCNDIEPAVIASELDTKPCSVLEMLIALAMRIEENIMIDLDDGSRCERWFWSMIRNLGLDDMTNIRYDSQKVNEIIFAFLERRYARDGRGGLFTVPNYRHDMRQTEIWYQMMWYLDNIINVD